MEIFFTPEKRSHLGDGVYANFDGYGVGISVNDHRSPEVVYFEPEVVEKLSSFLKAHQDYQSQRYPTPMIVFYTPNNRMQIAGMVADIHAEEINRVLDHMVQKFPGQPWNFRLQTHRTACYEVVKEWNDAITEIVNKIKDERRPS